MCNHHSLIARWCEECIFCKLFLVFGGGVVVFSWYTSTAWSGEVYIYCIWANVKLENSFCIMQLQTLVLQEFQSLWQDGWPDVWFFIIIIIIILVWFCFPNRCFLKTKTKKPKKKNNNKLLIIINEQRWVCVCVLSQSYHMKKLKISLIPL